MENFQHAVFFNASNLSVTDLALIKQYFQIKRRSGGETCEVEKVSGNTYKICFMTKEAQERVLRKTDHVVILSNQKEFHVSLSSHCTETDKQPEASDPPDPQKHESAKPLEKVFKLDLYLLRYLSECMNASSYLEQHLTSISSSFQIQLDSEEVVVVRDQAAQDFPLKKWLFEVEQVFEELQRRYVLHFEVEPERLVILQEHCLSNENLRIYFEEEACIAVVVGESEQVEKILQFLDVFLNKHEVQRHCHISEKEYALVKKQFEQITRSSFSAIEITQERPGILTLKGPEKEVRAGEKDILKLIAEINEKRIPLHETLKTFLESSDVIQHFQNRFQHGLCSPVLLETAGLHLLLLSLSEGALQEAAAAMQRELCFETVSLVQAETQSPGFNILKEDLSEAVQQANREGVKVKLSYQHETSSDPIINVQLVGYATKVCVLKEIVLDYKRNPDNSRRCFPLPEPEMVEHFFEILKLAGLKQGNVEINPTCSPSPCVHLTGPRCEVQLLKENLESTLQRLVKKRFVIDGPGARDFFQGEGMETLKLVKNSFQVEILPINDGQKSSKVPKDTSYTDLQSSLPPIQTDYSEDMHNYSYSDEIFQTDCRDLSTRMVDNRWQAPAPVVPIQATSRGRHATNQSDQSRSQPVDLNSFVSSLPVTQAKAAFLVIGFTLKDVSDACQHLQRGYDNQCSTHSFSSEEIECLTGDEMNQLLSKVKLLHLHVKSDSDCWTVKGLKDGVNEVVTLIQRALRRQIREKDQERLFSQVTWCILGPQGVWQKIPIEMNYKLERGDVKDGIVDAQGVQWTVDLTKMVATACGTGQKTYLKRLENLPDFLVPIYWDNMAQGELIKVINLDQSSAEYKRVKADFKKTETKTVLKIERIQNVPLRRLYEVRKSELEIRNDSSVGAGEKILYHGTTKEACLLIKNTNFNRSYAGQNATVYGVGTYFAVDASYSAHRRYSVPTSDGTQLMFVARVLTGHYTQGNRYVRIPPVRLPPDQLYDSVVDNMQNPSMFVVFHDCQAYPDYQITFK